MHRSRNAFISSFDEIPLGENNGSSKIEKQDHKCNFALANNQKGKHEELQQTVNSHCQFDGQKSTKKQKLSLLVNIYNAFRKMK